MLMIVLPRTIPQDLRKIRRFVLNVTLQAPQVTMLLLQYLHVLLMHHWQPGVQRHSVLYPSKYGGLVPAWSKGPQKVEFSSMGLWA